MAPAAMHRCVHALLEKLKEGPEAVPAWVLGGLYVAMMLFVISQITITYTHGSVVATLAMVEDPSPTALLRTTAVVDPDAPPPYADEPDAKEPALVAEEVLLVDTKPITSSNRGTVQHMRQMAGKKAGYRGLGVLMLYGIFTHGVASFFSRLLGPTPLMLGVAFIASQLVLLRLNMVWTHTVISQPSAQWFYQRLRPQPHTARKLLLPTLAWASVHAAIPMALVALTALVGLHEDLLDLAVFEYDGGVPVDHRGAIALAASMKTLMIFGVAAGLLLFVYLPVNVALVRCQAALLPDHDLPMVPLDRTFGGRCAAPDVPLRVRDAWRSFDWNARVRLFKVYLRTFGYQVLVTVVYALITLGIVGAWAMTLALKDHADPPASSVGSLEFA